MAHSLDKAEEALTEDEITGTEIPTTSSASSNPPAKRNAFTQLMAPLHQAHTEFLRFAGQNPSLFGGRDGLGAYTADPTAFPASRVFHHSADFVYINDLYPKSSVHTLLLPVSPRKLLHPYEALADPPFLAAVRAETARLRTLVAQELRRRYGRYSAKEARREAALRGDDAGLPPRKRVRTGGEGQQQQQQQDGGEEEGEQDAKAETDKEGLPEGRDWSRDVISGVHAVPSMTHLHVHVLSVDRFSDCLRHRKHYNSFNTPFFVDVDDFPLAANDPRREPTRAGYLDEDLVCWRCKRNFGRAFAKLKAHLAEEFEAWKRE